MLRTVHVELSEVFYEQLEEFSNEKRTSILENLVHDFKRYKSAELSDNRIKISYFGCDNPYTSPYSAISNNLNHIHLKFLPDHFNPNTPIQDRKCRMDDPENDAALVYTQGFIENNYFLIITILYPDAHGLARQNKIMNKMIKVAKKFRDKY